jgi:hypothetical protein
LPGDLAGKEAHLFVLPVNRPDRSPTFGIFKPSDSLNTNEDEVIIEGIVVDDSGISEILLTIILFQNKRENRKGNSFCDALKEGENIFVISARDIAGYETRTALKVFKVNRVRNRLCYGVLHRRTGIELSVSLSSLPEGYSMTLSMLRRRRKDRY